MKIKEIAIVVLILSLFAFMIINMKNEQNRERKERQERIIEKKKEEKTKQKNLENNWYKITFKVDSALLLSEKKELVRKYGEIKNFDESGSYIVAVMEKDNYKKLKTHKDIQSILKTVAMYYPDSTATQRKQEETTKTEAMSSIKEGDYLSIKDINYIKMNLQKGENKIIGTLSTHTVEQGDRMGELGENKTWKMEATELTNKKYEVRLINEYGQTYKGKLFVGKDYTLSIEEHITSPNTYVFTHETKNTLKKKIKHRVELQNNFKKLKNQTLDLNRKLYGSKEKLNQRFEEMKRKKKDPGYVANELLKLIDSFDFALMENRKELDDYSKIFNQRTNALKKLLSTNKKASTIQNSDVYLDYLYAYRKFESLNEMFFSRMGIHQNIQLEISYNVMPYIGKADGGLKFVDILSKKEYDLKRKMEENNVYGNGMRKLMYQWDGEVTQLLNKKKNEEVEKLNLKK